MVHRSGTGSAENAVPGPATTGARQRRGWVRAQRTGGAGWNTALRGCRWPWCSVHPALSPLLLLSSPSGAARFGEGGPASAQGGEKEGGWCFLLVIHSCFLPATAVFGRTERLRRALHVLRPSSCGSLPVSACAVVIGGQGCAGQEDQHAASLPAGLFTLLSVSPSSRHILPQGKNVQTVLMHCAFHLALPMMQEKNVGTDALEGKVGRIYMPKQVG